MHLFVTTSLIGVFVGLLIAIVVSSFTQGPNRSSYARHGLIGAVAYILFVCVSISLHKYVQFLSYTGKKPFFEDSMFGELVVVPAVLFALLSVLVTPIGLFCGWLCGKIARHFSRKYFTLCQYDCGDPEATMNASGTKNCSEVLDRPF